MKYTTILLYTFLFLGIMSCKPKQNYIYMSNANPTQEIAEYKFLGNHIQEGDELLILVSALDDIAVRPFNISTMTNTNNDNSASVRTTPPSEYVVNPEGYINFPVLGEILVKGKTHQELRRDLEIRLKEYLTDPLVSVALKNFNISVLGEVASPGQKSSSTQKINVFQALALAGDMTPSGDRTKVKLIRSQEGAPDQVINMDLANSNITSSPYYYLQQNDILYVEPDNNRQISANSNTGLDRFIKYGGVALGLITLVISLTR